MNYPSLSLSHESIENAFKVTENLEKKHFRRKPAFKDKFATGDAQKCEKCDFKTCKHEQMRQHILIKHSEVKNKCSYCDYTHYYPNRVKIHENHIHKKIPRITHKKRMVCNNIQCPYFCTRECTVLENHGLHFCTKCKYATKRTSDLKLHIQRVHEGVVFSCEECDHSNTSRWQLTRHIRSVHEGVVFSCDECQYSAPEKRNLNEHIRAVHEGVDLTCKICQVSLKTEKSLKDHIRRTHGSKMFSCEQCKFSTTTKNYLGCHIQSVHDGIIFSCISCSFTTKTKKVLNKHIQRVHEARIAFKCEHCSYSSKTKTDLISHKKVHNEITYKSEDCKSSVKVENV